MGLRVDALACLAGRWEGKQKRNLLTSPELRVFCEELINRCCMAISMGLLQTLVPAGRTHQLSCLKLCLVIVKGMQEQHTNTFSNRI